MAGEIASGGPGSGSGGVSGVRAARVDLFAAALLAMAALLLVVLVVQARERRAAQAAVDRTAAAFAAAESAEARVWSKEAWAAAQTVVDVAMADLHAQDGSPLFVRSYARTTTLLQRAITAADAARTAAESARRTQEPATRSFVHVIRSSDRASGRTPAEERERYLQAAESARRDAERSARLVRENSRLMLTTQQPPAGVSTRDAYAALEGARSAIERARALVGRFDHCKETTKNFRKDMEDFKGRVAGLSANQVEELIAQGKFAAAIAGADALRAEAEQILSYMWDARTQTECR
jgi:hypothetical protein